MVTLEQVKLLESKVGKALSYVETLSAENATLREKLDGYRRRIDELETVVLAFKEDQGRIEAGIVSALERLNQFEDAVERGISEVRNDAQEEAIEPQAAPAAALSPAPEEPVEEISAANQDFELDSDAGTVADDSAGADKSGELDIF